MSKIKKYTQLAYIGALVTLLMFFTHIVLAEKNDSKEEQPKDKVTKQSKPYTSKRSRIKTLEEFIPSEEVSADKPVAFPNDI